MEYSLLVKFGNQILSTAEEGAKFSAISCLSFNHDIAFLFLCIRLSDL